MRIIVQPNILPSDISGSELGSSVFVIPETIISRGVPENTILAGAKISSERDPHGKSVHIGFHMGQNRWNLVTEYHSAQIATRYEAGTLADLVKRLESATGIELPLIRIIEPGVGVHSAQSTLASDNPWAMIDGEMYDFTHRGANRRYIASVKHGLTRVSEIIEGENSNEFYDPRIIFSAAAWKSMEHVQLEIKASKSLGPRP